MKIRMILPVLLGLLLAPLLQAQPATPDELLRSIREQRSTEQAAMQAREAEFVRERQQQQQRMASAERELAAVQARSEQLRAEFDQLDQALAEAEIELQQRSGNLGELFGVVRQSAGDSLSQWQDSMLNVQLPQRTQQLRELSESRRIPTVEQLEGFWLTLVEDLAASARVSRFQAPVIGLDGNQQTTQVVALGPFSALAGSDYLLYQPEHNRLLVAPRQPAGRALAESFVATSEGVAELWVDPTRGNVISQLQLTPSLLERIAQGGLVGYVIIALGIFGVLLSFARIGWLQLIQTRVDRQIRDLDQLRDDNPLGRVLGVIGSRPRLEELDTLELKLDEAILKETPKLERGQSLLKLLAAVAPLLGLLGTVTGMIATFQAITLFGTGDPKLMAGGISQALVTTVLGLIAAIPLLFLHGLVAARSKALVQLLEQQSAGLIALHLGNGDKRGD